MRVAMIFASVLLAAAATLHFLDRAVAAGACPSCYGFTDVGGGVFVERSMSLDARNAARATVEAARERVHLFYGNLESDPRVLVCATDDCYRPLGGGSRGIALLDRALILSPSGRDAVIAAHELAHAEFHRRIGFRATIARSVPQWFDEGLAVFVSDDPRYLAPNSEPDRCLLEPDGDLPASRTAWIETASNADLYAKAACKVSRWIKLHDGSKGVRQLAASVAGGEGFDQLAR